MEVTNFCLTHDPLKDAMLPHSHKMRQTPVHRRFCPVRAALSMQTLRAHAGNFLIAEGYVRPFEA
jgi:hypothetical protein